MTSSTFSRCNVGYQAPFAPGGEIGGHGRAQPRIGNLGREMRQRLLAVFLDSLSGTVEEPAGVQLEFPVRLPTAQPLKQRKPAVARTDGGRDRPVVTGSTHAGVRWYTSTLAAVFAISGTNWMALAPVPITATRAPARS
ncbi:MAG TPA: hypothetical protein VHD82_03380 [Amycolatopsis sp.]|nr:hypothetical protein [Amycolatopsis sp.]